MTGEHRGNTEKVRKQLQALACSPELFLRDIDPGRNAAILSPMSEDSYRRSSFLDSRLVRDGERDIVVPVDALIRILEETADSERHSNYIFHVGHCGSTLLSRLLGELDQFHALREPAVLMGLSRSFRALDESGFEMTRERWKTLFDLAVALLSRTWRADQTALVKATSHAGNLIPGLMNQTGREKALFLYTDIETYLVTMLRSHTRNENRLYAKEFRIREFASLAPSRSRDIDDYPDDRIAALTWLLHTREIDLACADPELASRVLVMSFEDYLADPPRHLSRVCQFMGVAVEDEALQALLFGPTATSHAKLPDADFDAAKRTSELDVARKKSSQEIDAGLAWAQEVCDEEPAFGGLIARYRCPRALPTQR
ncbi:MAG: hypothetical protein ACR2QU_03735 [Gammaproteobacteria bacterium]